jgi:hypothetical protein
VSNPLDDDDPQLARVLFRYRLIADAVEAPKESRGPRLREIAAEQHSAPDGSLVRVSLRTLQRWVQRFAQDKLAGLRRRPRQDRGRLRGLTTAALERAIALRREEPTRSTPTLIDILERADAVAPGSLKRATRDRHLDRQGASRRQLHVLGIKRHARRRAESTAAIRFQAVPADDAHLTVARLCERLRTCGARPLGPVEQEQAAATLHTLAPVEIAIADVALKTAVAVLGSGLHAAQYLDALRAHVLRVRRKGPP